MSYSHLFFDADNTLFDFDRAEEGAFRDACLSEGIEYRRELLDTYKSVNDAVWKEFERGKITAEVLRTERFERLSRKREFRSVHPARMSAAYLKALSGNGILLPGALELIRSLSRSHTMGIITNGLKEVQEGRLKTSPLRKFMSFVVISDAIGFKKPEEAFFRYAHEKAGNPPKSTCLVIGDSLRSDIQGGNSYGFDTCWYAPDGSSNRSAISPTYTISSLNDLISIVGETPG